MNTINKKEIEEMIAEISHEAIAAIKQAVRTELKEIITSEVKQTLGAYKPVQNEQLEEMTLKSQEAIFDCGVSQNISIDFSQISEKFAKIHDQLTQFTDEFAFLEPTFSQSTKNKDSQLPGKLISHHEKIIHDSRPTKVYRKSINTSEISTNLNELDTINEFKKPKNAAELKQLIDVILNSEFIAELEIEDPLLEAKLRGVEDKERLLNYQERALTSSEAAKLLSMTRQSIDNRRRENRLLGLSMGKRGYRYPAWQFVKGDILPGWEKVLAKMEHLDDWSKLIFMLSGDPKLDGQVPLDCLQNGEIEKVISAVEAYGNQRAV